MHYLSLSLFCVCVRPYTSLGGQCTHTSRITSLYGVTILLFLYIYLLIFSRVSFFLLCTRWQPTGHHQPRRASLLVLYLVEPSALCLPGPSPALSLNHLVGIMRFIYQVNNCVHSKSKYAKSTLLGRTWLALVNIDFVTLVTHGRHRLQLTISHYRF